MGWTLLAVLVAATGPAADPPEPAKLTVIPARTPTTITIEVGQTVLLDVKLNVARPRFVAVPPPAAVTVLVRDPRSGRHTKLWPWIEVVSVDKRKVRARVPLTGVRPGVGTVTLAADVRERGANEPVAVRPLSFDVEVVPAKGTREDVDVQKATFDFFTTAALRARGRLEKTKLPAERTARPPMPTTIPEIEIDAVAEVFRHRLRAEAAHRRLRALADLADEAIAIAAARSIAAADGEPSKAQKEAKAIDRVTNEKAIAMVANAVQNLRVAAAHGMADKLLASGRLDPTELASVLALRGLVRLVRGEQAKAERLFGQALCLAPEVKIDVKRPMFTAAIEKARAANTCRTPLAVGNMTATRVGTDDGPKLEVLGSFGPDPHHLIQKANVQLWRYDGSMETSRTISVDHAAGGRIDLQFSSADAHQDGHVLLKIFLLDANGNEIVTAGDPDPVAVPLVIGDGGGFEIPTWFWYVAGGIAVAGAATAGAVVLSKNQEVDRVVGPVEVRF